MWPRGGETYRHPSIRALGLGLALLALLLAACSSGSSKPSTTTPQTGSGSPTATASATGSPYLIGIDDASSGPAGFLGQDEVKTVKLVVDQVNAAGGINGHPIKLESRDNGGDAKQAVVIAKALLEQHPVALMGGAVVAQMKAIEPLVTNGPLVVDFGSGYTPPTPSYVFSISPYDYSAIDATFRWFRGHNITKFGLLASTDSTGQLAVDEIQHVLKEPANQGLQLVGTERFEPSAPDVTPQLTRLKSDSPQAIIAWQTGAPAAVVAKDFTQLNLDMPLVVSWGNGSFSFAKATQSFAPKNLYVPVFKAMVYDQLPANDPFAASGKSIAEEWQKLYGTRPDIGLFLAYDPIKILLQALKEAGPDSSKMVKYIEGIHNYQGVAAIYSFSTTDHKGGGSEAITLAAVQDGQFHAAK